MSFHFFFAKTDNFLLDRIPSIFSVSTSRKLSSNATYAMRIRRASDDAELDVGFAGNSIDNNAIKDFGGYNILKYTEDLSQGWDYSTYPVAVTPSSDKTANNTANTFTVQDNTSSGPSLLFVLVPVIGATTYNASIYLKNINTSNNKSTFNCYGISSSAETNVTINWATNTASFTNVGNNGRNLLFESQSDGFFRLSYDFDVASSDHTILYRMWITDRNYYSETGSIRVGGFQLTAGSGVKPYQARTTGGASDCFITKWYEQSGQKNNVTQTVAVSQTKIYDVASGDVTRENGKPAMVFDGVDDNLAISGVAGKSNIDAYFVNRHDETSATSNSATQYVYLSDRQGVFGFVGDKNSTSTVFKVDSNVNFYKNNNLLSPQTRGQLYTLLGQTQNIVNHKGLNASNWYSCNFGMHPSTGNPWAFEGTLQEIIIFDRNLTTSERTLLHSDINNHFNIY